jgi:hypothetical protein
MENISQNTRRRIGKELKMSLSIVFIISTVLSYLFLPILKISTDPQIINTSLANQNVYGRLNENGFEIIQQMGAFQNGTGRLDPAFMSRIISRELSPKWWQVFFFRYLGRYYLYLKNGTLEDNPLISSTSLKTNLLNRNNENILIEEIGTYSKCTEGQKQKIISNMNGTAGIIPMCLVDDSLLIPFVGFLQSELIYIANEIPAELRFPGNIENSLLHGVLLIRAVYLSSIIFIILALCLFLALSIMMVNHLHSYLRWMGKVLSIAGSVGIVVEIVLFLAVNSVLPDAFQKLLSGFPAALLQPFMKVMNQVATVFVYYYGLPPIAITAFGLIILVFHRIYPDRKVLT